LFRFRGPAAEKLTQIRENYHGEEMVCPFDPLLRWLSTPSQISQSLTNCLKCLTWTSSGDGLSIIDEKLGSALAADTMILAKYLTGIASPGESIGSRKSVGPGSGSGGRGSESVSPEVRDQICAVWNQYTDETSVPDYTFNKEQTWFTAAHKKQRSQQFQKNYLSKWPLSRFMMSLDQSISRKGGALRWGFFCD
jgi:hypothetical protein